MIDVALITARLQMQAALDRIRDSEAAHELADGLWEPWEGEVLPAPRSSARRRAWERTLRQVETIGPRVVNTKISGALGQVNWGVSTDELDDALADIDLNSLSRRLLHSYIVDGIMSLIAHELTDQDGNATGEFTLSRLGGFLEPITHPDDVDVVLGLYQAWQVGTTALRDFRMGGRVVTSSQFNDTVTLAKGSAKAKWNVRVYDWSDGEDQAIIREWRNLRDPTHLANRPEVIDNAPVPRLEVWHTSSDGLVLGEMLQHLKSLKAHWSTEARLYLSEETAGQPMIKTKGDVDITAVGPTEVISAPVDGDAEWMSPGDLDQLTQLRQMRLERIREDLALPGGFLGNDSPSGEAFKEANVRYEQTSDRYAQDLEDLLNRGVEDLAALLTTETAEIAVVSNKSRRLQERVDVLLRLVEGGIMPASVASREVQVFFPTWSDDELEEFLESRRELVSPEDAIAALNGEA